jgi:hypothetical protein
MSLGVGKAKARLAAKTNTPATTDFNNRNNMQYLSIQSEHLSGVALCNTDVTIHMMPRWASSAEIQGGVKGQQKRKRLLAEPLTCAFEKRLIQ